MKKIYICDDELVYREQLASMLNSIMDKQNYPAMIALKAKSSEELLDQMVDFSSSIYFLDVNIIGSQMNGFELGKEIRRRDPQAVIVFVTTFEELAVETFKYRLEVMDYIVKDQPENMTTRIADCIESAMKRSAVEQQLEDKCEMLVVKFGDGVLRLLVSDILFIETSNRSHMVVIHTINQSIEVINKLQELEKELPNQFIRSHRSFLINQEYIKRYNLKQNLLELTNGQTCLVSRRMKKQLKERLTFLTS